MKRIESAFLKEFFTGYYYIRDFSRNKYDKFYKIKRHEIFLKIQFFFLDFFVYVHQIKLESTTTEKGIKKDFMAKKAEYFISGIRMNPAGSQIESLRRHKANISSVAECDYISRHAIIEDIKNGVNYATAFPDKEGNLRKGSVISIYKDKFLRSNENNTEKDNLGNLPLI